MSGPGGAPTAAFSLERILAAKRREDGRVACDLVAVDLDAADRSVELLSGVLEKATRPEVLGGIGGFGGLFALDTSRYEQPVLVSSTDGVGTKVDLARRMGVLDTVGIDLVAMVVDDIVATGAEPLFFNDYLVVGRLDPERVAAIVRGIAEGCAQAGCALVGGETAEHPGLLGEDDRRTRGQRGEHHQAGRDEVDVLHPPDPRNPADRPRKERPPEDGDEDLVPPEALPRTGGGDNGLQHGIQHESRLPGRREFREHAPPEPIRLVPVRGAGPGGRPRRKCSGARQRSHTHR